MRSGGGNRRNPASYTALTYLLLFGVAITVPLLLLLGAMLLQSASAQREQLENRISQVLDALVNDLDRDLDRDLTILHTLATSQALASGIGAPSTIKPTPVCKGARIWCWSIPTVGNWSIPMCPTGNSPP